MPFTITFSDRDSIEQLDALFRASVRLSEHATAIRDRKATTDDRANASKTLTTARTNDGARRADVRSGASTHVRHAQ